MTVYSVEPSESHLQNNENERTIANVLDRVRDQCKFLRIVFEDLSNLKIILLTLDTISNWKKSDFISWIYNSFLHSSNMHILASEAFLNLTEEQSSRLLRRMNVDDFVRLDKDYGKVLFEQLMDYESKMIIF